MPTTMVLADDHVLFREGLKSLLSEIPDSQIVGEADTGREAVKLCLKLNPDLVLMDVAMPDLNGVEATRQIHLQSPETKIIALSMHSSRRFVMEMLRAGARGYLLKNCDFQELVAAVTTVRDNRPYLSPSIASIVLDNISTPSGHAISDRAGLTNREKEVVQLLVEGKKASEVANQLSVSVKTVQTHRRNIMAKLNMRSLAELTKFAIREGITSPDL